MGKFVEPIANMASRSTNGSSLHGRSVHRPEDVSGHNVFRGFNTPGKGDAVDLFAPLGTPVVAIADGTQTRHALDDTGREHIYLTGDGFVATYAHINTTHSGVGHKFSQGDVVGHLRPIVPSAHLHFELWLDGVAVSATSGNKLRDEMLERMEIDISPRLIVARRSDDPHGMDVFDYKDVGAVYDSASKAFTVSTKTLAQFLGKPHEGIEPHMKIRPALQALGIAAQAVTFDLKHMVDKKDPRAYAFVNE